MGHSCQSSPDRRGWPRSWGEPGGKGLRVNTGVGDGKTAGFIPPLLQETGRPVAQRVKKVIGSLIFLEIGQVWPVLNTGYDPGLQSHGDRSTQVEIVPHVRRYFTQVGKAYKVSTV